MQCAQTSIEPETAAYYRLRYVLLLRLARISTRMRMNASCHAKNEVGVTIGQKAIHYALGRLDARVLPVKPIAPGWRIVAALASAIDRAPIWPRQARNSSI
jgi:hypothetical protein